MNNINKLINKYTKHIYQNTLKNIYEEAQNNFHLFCNLICNQSGIFNDINLNQKWVKCILNDFNNVINSSTIDRAIYNIPPRTGKTTLLTIIGSCFLLGNKKNIKILIVNANNEKLEEINNYIKNIINSQVYQKIFTNIQDLSKKNAVKKIRLNNNNHITFKVSGSASIGSGFHYMFFDDYLNPNNERSETRKEQAILHLTSFLGRKEYKPATKIFIIEQRIGFRDTTALCKDRWDGAIEYNHLVLPYYFEDNIKINNIEFDIYEYLDEKFNEKDKNIIIKERGEVVFQTQYQQNPVTNNESIIKAEHLNYYNINELESYQFEYLFISIDTAIKDNINSDYSVMLCFGIRGNPRKHYLLAMLKKKVQYIDLRNEFANFYAYCQRTFKNHINGVIIEDKSNGYALISELKSYLIINPNNNEKIITEVFAYNPPSSKEIRLREVSGYVMGDYFLLPKGQPWCQDIVYELVNFPNVKHDDICDAISQYIKVIATKVNY